MNWEEMIINIVGNAINGLIAGIFTVISVQVTIRYEKKKEAKQERKQKYNNRPELIARNYIDEGKKDFDMQLLAAMFDVDEEINFNYPKEYKNRNEYISKDFIFKNIGKTAIESLDIVCTFKKKMSIFHIECAQIFMNDGMINYACNWDKKIFPGEELKVRLYFHSNFIISPGLIIQFSDSNGMLWEQPLFENDCNLYSPREISYKEYKDNISVEKALECFEKPYLW